MTQTFEKEIEKKTAKFESEVDESLGDLNVRYFEGAMSLENAFEKIESSDINFSSRLNF